jgi:hypothetical protein
MFQLPDGLIPKALNDADQIIGTSVGQPVLWDRHQGLQSVNSLIDKSTSAGWVITSLVDINRRGWMIGWGSYGGQTVPVMLKPADISQVFELSVPFSISNQTLGSGIQKSADALLEWHPPHLGFDNSFSIWPLGDFGASAGLDVGVETGFRFGYSVSAGGANVTYSGTVTLEFPDKFDLVPGQPFQVQSQLFLDPSSGVSTTPPKADAKLTAVFNGDLAAHLGAEAFGDQILNLSPFPDQHPRKAVDLFGLDDALGGSEDRDYSLANGVFTGHVHIPHLVAQGSVDPASGSLVGAGQDLFLGLNTSLSQALSSLFGLSLDFPIDLSMPMGGVDGDIKFLQLSYRSEIGLNQKVTVAARPTISLTFSDPSIPPVQFKAGEESPPITLPVTSGDAYATVMPLVSLPNQVMNEFSAGFARSLSFVPLEVAVSVNAAGNSLLNMDQSPLVINDSYSPISLPLASETFALNFPDLPSAPLTITSKARPAPTIASVCGPKSPNVSCPTSVDLIIISDRVPESTALGQFVATATAATLLTVRGTNFWPNQTQVQVKYYGATYSINADVKNSATLQFQLPNQVRVLPGVMQIVVTTSHSTGPSNSSDFAVGFPLPEIDSAFPTSLWAADPHFKDVLLSISGTNFIDRPDYFVEHSNLANPPRLHKFWRQAFPSAPSLGAWFHDFPFDKMSYPISILWNNESLSLYPGPSASGAVPSLLPPALYDRSEMVSISVQNPAPGGGVSSSPYPVWVAAPLPQVLAVDPASAAPPSDTAIRVAVHGSSSLPSGQPGETATGFEANSIVQLDGNALHTTFISATDLLAEVPATASLSGVAHSITVVNPYVDQNGVAGTYQSQPIAWQVMNPSPTITAVQPGKTCVDAAAFQAPNNVNLLLKGDGFIASSSVSVNGAARNVQFVSAKLLGVFLSPADVHLPQTLDIAVQNPTPGGGSSHFNFQISSDEPQIVNITPQQVEVGSSLLQVAGSNFHPDIKAVVNGGARAVAFGSDKLVTVTLQPKDVANPGTLTVMLVNGGPDYCNSAAVAVTVKK